MKTCRILALVLALMLALGCVAFAAESGMYTYSLDLRANLNETSNTLTMQKNGAYVLTDVAGNALTTEPYIHMSEDYTYPVLEVALQEGMNVRGIIDGQGKVLVPCQYGKIDVISEDWQVALVLEQVATGDYDFTNNNDDKFIIAKVDCYYQGQLAGTLDRTQYDSYMEGYGAYLYINSDNNDEYGYTLNATHGLIQQSKGFYVHMEYSHDGFHYGSNQQAFTSTCTLRPEEVCQSVIYNEDGNFVDLQGNVIADGGSPYKEFASVDRYGEYMISRTDNGKYGVMDLKGNEILPAVYDDIAHTTDGNDIFASGYQLVVKDGRVGYVDMAGNEVAGFQYEVGKDSVQGYLYNPNFCCIENMGKFVVITPTAGELTETFDDVGYAYAGHTMLIVTKGDTKGVIDMDGNVVVPFGNYYPDMSSDGTIVGYSNSGDTDNYYVYYHFPKTDAAETAPAASSEAAPETGDGASVAESLLSAATQALNNDQAAPEADTAAAADGSWNCAECGTANNGKFCTECGAGKPAANTCSGCGYTLGEGETAKFCPECGTKF